MMLMGKGVLSEKFQADFRQWLGTGALFILLLYGVLIIVSGRIDFSIYDGK
jgi:hypothetical protein